MNPFFFIVALVIALVITAGVIFLSIRVVGLTYAMYWAAKVENIRQHQSREAYEATSIEMLKFFIKGTILFPDMFVLGQIEKHSKEFDDWHDQIKNDPRYLQISTLLGKHRAGLVRKLTKPSNQKRVRN